MPHPPHADRCRQASERDQTHSPHADRCRKASERDQPKAAAKLASSAPPESWRQHPSRGPPPSEG